MLLGGIIVARIIFRALGFVSSDEYLFPPAGDADFSAAAQAEAVWHSIRYGLVIALCVGVSALRGRRKAAAFGLGRVDGSWLQLLATGVVMGLVVVIPPHVLNLVDLYIDIGPGTPFWELQARTPWNFEFWVFMFVSSFGIVPLVEEFVARGYMLGRFREAYSPGASLLLMGVTFALAHGQYHQPNVLAMGYLASIIVGSVVWGYSIYRTGSLIPAIVAHGVVNLPVTHTVVAVEVGLGIVLLFGLARHVVDWSRSLGRLLRTIDDGPAILVAGAFVATMLLTLRLTPWTPYFWLAVYAILFGASLSGRSMWRTQPPSSG